MTESPRWTQVRTDELLALHKVAQQAREAVMVAADVGVYLGPLRAALDATPYHVSSLFEIRRREQSDESVEVGDADLVGCDRCSHRPGEHDAGGCHFQGCSCSLPHGGC